MEDKRPMRKTLKHSNDISSNVYVIHLDGSGAKTNMHVIDGSHVVDYMEIEVLLGDDAHRVQIIRSN